MAKKKPAPVITHTEILVRAIHNLENRIQGWQDTVGNRPNAEEILADICKTDYEKLDALKTMYRIENGVDYE